MPLCAAKLLKDAGIKLSSLRTKSAWEMMQALADGERNVDVLAENAKGVMRNKREELKLALTGRFGELHAG